MRNKRENWNITYRRPDDHSDAKFQPRERTARAAHMSKDSKRNWCPRVHARVNVSGFAKWQRVPLGSICAFEIHWCSTCRRWAEAELAGGSQLRSLRGVSILSHPTRLLQPPSEHRRHLVITDSFFSFSFSRLESSMNGCALIINVP